LETIGFLFMLDVKRIRL